LIKTGVEEWRLEAVGYGAARPIAPNDNNANMARNRRIEFVVRRQH
jgi:outer membrane protein OmpA-like peptidoglycan-associated protein